jgi:carboxypeptidase D
VQAAINAPAGISWASCTTKVVFNSGSPKTTGNHDLSLGPAQNDVLRTVIEYTNNAIIGSGSLDMLVPTNGTLLAIQNMTWNGKQGFQEYPGGKQFYVPPHLPYNGLPFAAKGQAGWGELGTWGSERGLTFYEVRLAGHGKSRC